ncbi:MAG: hypothetical protein HUJ89_03735 [Bacteroidales bacterium]|mgnify:FL=1|nr:hypothetical protein [Bacteroidales bacterium]
MKKLMALAAVLTIFAAVPAFAQLPTAIADGLNSIEDNSAEEEEFTPGWEMTVGADQMTAYNWRGVRSSVWPWSYNIMPQICFDWYLTSDLSFEIGLYDVEEARCTWKTDEFGTKSANRYSELGAWFYFNFYGFTLEVQGYGLDRFMWNRGDYKEEMGGAVLDLGLRYTLSVLDWFQPSIAWYSILAGDDFRYSVYNEEYTDLRAFSSYLELALPFYYGNGFSTQVTVGCNPWQSPYYSHYTDGFVVSNLGLNLGYTFEFDNGISIPITLEGGYNFAERGYNWAFDDHINTQGWYYGIKLGFNFTKWLSK